MTDWNKAFEFVKKIKGCSEIIKDFEKGKIDEAKLNHYMSKTEFFIKEINKIKKYRECSPSEIKNLDGIVAELQMLQNYKVHQKEDEGREK